MGISFLTQQAPLVYSVLFDRLRYHKSRQYLSDFKNRWGQVESLATSYQESVLVD